MKELSGEKGMGACKVLRGASSLINLEREVHFFWHRNRREPENRTYMNHHKEIAFYAWGNTCKGSEQVK